MSALGDEPRRYTVELTLDALSDVRSIRSYIEDTLYSPAAARRTVEGVLDVADALSMFPSRNAILATLSDGSNVRLARSGGYLLLYLILEDDHTSRVVIFAVLHGSRDVEARLASLLARIRE